MIDITKGFRDVGVSEPDYKQTASHDYNYFTSKGDNNQVVIFSGYYPRKPQHTCKRIAVGRSYDGDAIVALYSNRFWRDRNTGTRCDACFYEKVMRHCKQVEMEVLQSDEFGYGITTPLKLEQVRKYHSNSFYGRKCDLDIIKELSREYLYPSRMSLIRYLAIPQSDDKLFVIHNSPLVPHSKLLSTNLRNLFEVIATALVNMPDGARIRSTKQFGLDYSGAYGSNNPVNKSDITIRFSMSEPLQEELKEYYIKGKYKLTTDQLIDKLEETDTHYTIIENKKDENNEKADEQDS